MGAINQDIIWEHFQNEGVDSFRDAVPRLEFLVRQLRRNERVLNIGVGSGALERIAAAKAVEIWALDPSARAIGRLRDELGLGDRAQTGYSQNMPFPDGHFDVVVMSEVLEHLETDVLDRTLPEVRRVLRSGGRFIGTVPANERLQNSEVVCPQCQHHFHRWGHRSSFNAAAMRALLARNFAVETVHERFFNEWDSVGWRRRIAGLVKKFLSWRGIGSYGVARNLFFVARKKA